MVVKIQCVFTTMQVYCSEIQTLIVVTHEVTFQVEVEFGAVVEVYLIAALITLDVANMRIGIALANEGGDPRQ